MVKVCQFFGSIVVGLLVLISSGGGICLAERHNPFSTPLRLRARVNFWKDVFAKHTSADFVIHHREYPYVIFEVVDLKREKAELSNIEFAHLKKREEESRVEAVRRAIRNLAAGGKPQSALEKRVQQQMRVIGATRRDYDRVLRDDLIRTQTGIRERYAEAIARSGRYLPMMERIFLDTGLPIELTRLPFIESSFDYTAYSSVGAAGIWQFMRATARGYMTVNDLVDERRDPLAATRAAAKYLRSAYARLGDWGLAVTSYNHGVAGVARKIKNAGTSNIVDLIESRGTRAFGFASENFYPEFLAAIEVYKERKKLFPEVREEKPVNFWEQRLTTSLSIGEAARRFRTSTTDLQTVNYALASSIWKGSRRIPAGYSLKIPLERGQKPYVPKEPVISSVKENTLTHVVRTGETIEKIAARYSTTPSFIRKVNNLKMAALRPGQMLVVKQGEKEEREQPEVRTIAKQLPPKKQVPVTTQVSASTGSIEYRVKSGDSLSEIAGRYNVPVSALRAANGLRSNSLRIGQKLRIPAQRVKGPFVATEAVRPDVVSSKKHYHEVQPGEVISTIARRHGLSVSKLQAMNNLKSTRIYPGQRLVVGHVRGHAAAPKTTAAVKTTIYVVKKGDVLSKIAQKYKVSVETLRKRNRIKGNRINPGQKLTIR